MDIELPTVYGDRQGPFRFGLLSWLDGGEPFGGLGEPFPVDLV